MNFLQKIKYNFQQQGVLTQIIVLNAAVYLTLNLSKNFSHLNEGGHSSLLKYLALPLGAEAFLKKFWTIFTYMFTHEDLGHLFWNMVLFYFVSQIFFTIMGQKKMLYLYVMSGLSGGALLLILSLIFKGSFQNSTLIGASASVLGVGAVMAVYSPNFRVYLFGVFDMAYKYFFLLTFVITTVIDLGTENSGGKIAHIGGVIFGLIYGYYLKKGNDLFTLSLPLKKKSKLKVVSHNTSYTTSSSPMQKPGSDEQAMDALLDKISKSGYDSLTKKEKDELFRLSQKK